MFYSPATGLSQMMTSAGKAPNTLGLPTVVVVDDDKDVRTALQNLFLSVGVDALVFETVHEFLQAKLPDVPRCLVLDIRLPGVSGLEFQANMVKLGVEIPIVFMTGHADIPMSVRAMKAGAVDFLPKPFRDQDMLDAVAVAIERDRTRRAEEQQSSAIRALLASLTSREAEVLQYVRQGLLNKQIAERMKLSEITVKIHRGNMMKKMQVNSVADLVRITEKITGK